MKRIAFTGHRPEGLPFGENEDSEGCRKLKEMIWNELIGRIEDGYGTFYCGAAKGADILCGELALRAQAEGKREIELVCVVPFRGHEKGWSAPWRARHDALLHGAAQVVYLSEHYYSGCYQVRDRYLVDHADAVLAVYGGGKRGGTAYTVRYAAKKGKEIVVFDPGTMRAERFSL